MWFQVATIRRIIGSTYKSASRKLNKVQVKDPQMKGSAQDHLIDLLNGGTLTLGTNKKSKTHDSMLQVQFYDLGLFCLSFLKFVENDMKDSIKISLSVNPEIQEVLFAISSVSEQLCQKHGNAMKKCYEDAGKEFCSLVLPSSYPRSYIELLRSVIDIKFSPKLTLTMHMGKTVYFVFPKNQHSEVLKFKESYLKQNSPRQASDIDDVYRLAKSFDVAAPSMCLGNVGDAKDLMELRPLDPKTVVYIGMLVKPDDHIEYLQRHRSPELDGITQEYNAELEFNKDQILVQLEKKEDLINCLTRLEKLYSRLAIESKEVARNCLPPNRDHLLVKELSSDRVSVTGSHSDMSGIFEHAQRDDDADTETETLEVISTKPASRSDHENKSNQSLNQQVDASQSASPPRPHRRRQRALAKPSLRQSDTQ